MLKLLKICILLQYADSKNCVMEFRQSLITLRIPTIIVVVGTGYEWERKEVYTCILVYSLLYTDIMWLCIRYQIVDTIEILIKISH